MYTKLSQWGPLLTSYINCGYCGEALPIKTVNRIGCPNNGRAFASHHPHDQYGDPIHNYFHAHMYGPALMQLGMPAGSSAARPIVRYAAEGQSTNTSAYVYSRTDTEEDEQLTMAIHASKAERPQSSAHRATPSQSMGRPIPFIYSQNDEDERHQLLMAISASTAHSPLAIVSGPLSSLLPLGSSSLSIRSPSLGSSSSGSSSAGSSSSSLLFSGPLSVGSLLSSQESAHAAPDTFVWDPTILARIRAANALGHSESPASSISDGGHAMQPMPIKVERVEVERVEIDLTLAGDE
ncbi:hypothetical protein C2E23DRAFT_863293 [Lenzites betulinus]|nr:hypothetical protein C2E23DRAFT_863293 [Lenzites betulinus]